MSQPHFPHFEAKIWKVGDRWNVDLVEITGASSRAKWRPGVTFDTRAGALDWARAKRDEIVQTRAETSTPEWVRL